MTATRVSFYEFYVTLSRSHTVVVVVVVVVYYHKVTRAKHDLTPHDDRPRYRAGPKGPQGLLGNKLVLHSSSSVGETEVCCCTGLGAVDCLCFIEK